MVRCLAVRRCGSFLWFASWENQAKFSWDRTTPMDHRVLSHPTSVPLCDSPPATLAPPPEKPCSVPALHPSPSITAPVPLPPPSLLSGQATGTHVKAKKRVVAPTRKMAAAETGTYLLGLNLFPDAAGMLELWWGICPAA